MTIRRCTRRIHFSAGHRVVGHEGCCAVPHGHNYHAWITAEPINGLDSVGRVVDFGSIKQKVGEWINRNWDHAMILNRNDWVGRCMMTAYDEAAEPRNEPLSKVFYLDSNPTAENLATYLLEVVCPRVLDGAGVNVVEVKLHETHNCYAIARSKDVSSQ